MHDDPDFMGEIIDEFVIESDELLEKLDSDLVALERAPGDAALINEIFRCVHTIKGTSGFLGFARISRLTHAAEDVLNRMRKAELQLSSAIMDAMLACVDLLKEMIACVQRDKKEPEMDVDALITTFQAILQGDASPTNASAEAKDPDPTDLALDISLAVDDPAAAEPAFSGVDEQIAVENTAKGEEVATSPPASDSADQKQTMHVRVPVSRLDHLMNLAGELVLGRNRLSQVTSSFESALTTVTATQAESGTPDLLKIVERNLDQLAEANSSLALVTSELQMAIMQTRMMPVGALFRKVPRLVRSLERETGKEVELVIEGEETELDKSVLEELSDPLMHLIRNALDHGIETPEAREARGKSRRGKLRLYAAQQGNHIFVGIEDDGGGLDPDKILERALDRKLISESEAERFNIREAYNLIFTPGFSTKTTVSPLSGRGVGMDVVKTNVSKLNGLIEVDSSINEGTSFLLKLPLTLAIIQGLLIQVAQEIFIVPIVSVLETLRVTPEQIQKIGSSRVVRVRESIIPLVDLATFFGLTRESEVPEEQYVVIAGVANKRIGLVVDALRGQEEVVIKSLGEFFEQTAAVAGATIMGDGRVRLIVDVSEILRLEQEKVNA